MKSSYNIQMQLPLRQIKLLRLSSREDPDLLSSTLPILCKWFPGLEFVDVPPDPSWPYSAGSIKDRAESLKNALAEKNIGTIWCARGGYGASDLLGLIDFEYLKGTTPRLIVGFSDVSALHSAFYAQLQWPGLHAPMPATSLWRNSGEDILQLRAILSGAKGGRVPLTETVSSPVTGKLFGGCFSVLTNLIGTPFFPKSLAGHILFFEDTGESPGRLCRFFNQWMYSGVLNGVKGIVLGDFRDCGNPRHFKQYIQAQLESRTDIPVFGQGQFGHCSPNFPLMIGANARVEGNFLHWQLGEGDDIWS